MNIPASPENFLVFGQPAIQQDEIDEVVDSLRSGWLGTGPKVHLFEKEFADYKQVKRAAAVNSCTAALHLSLILAGVGPGDEVITSATTFCATVNAIILTGATPVLADIEPDSLLLSPPDVLRRITPRTRAIVPVHLAGRPCNMDALIEIARAHSLKVIEDCAHAIEATYHGRPVGTFGDFGCFSFHATKNVTTGEGGMVIARQEEDVERVARLALHGLDRSAWNRFGRVGYRHYSIEEYGFKYNMMDLQAAIGIHQLRRVEANWKRREEVAERYRSALAELPVRLPLPPEPNTRHAHHLFQILVDEQEAGVKRDEFMDRMTLQNVGVGVHYLCLAEYPYYQKQFGWRIEDYPIASQTGEQVVSLPISPNLSDEDVDTVATAVSNAVDRRTNLRAVV